jgi:folate-binding protein YgfZ
VPSPLLGLPGAIGETVPIHYGDPLGEQRRFADGVSLVDASHYELIRLTGPDRLVWLDSISSNVFAGMSEGETREGLILDPHGHVEHQFLLIDDGDESWLLVEPGRADALAKWLLSMRFRMQVEIENVSEKWAVMASTREPSFVARTFIDPWPTVAQAGVAYSAEPHPAENFSLHWSVIPRGNLAPELSEHWSGTDALDAYLLRAARPTMADIDEKTLPHELDWLRTAVHLNKGCSRGQETIAKVHNLGHPPRRAVLLHLDGSDAELPEPGSEVNHNEKGVGRVTRVVRHYEWGPIAYALVKRSLDPNVDVEVRGTSSVMRASQEALVVPDAGATRREVISQYRAGR